MHFMKPCLNKLLALCQEAVPSNGFRFNNPLYSLDATPIDLCLSVFLWAEFRTTKEAVKLHVGLNQAEHLPDLSRCQTAVNMMSTLDGYYI